VVCVLTGHGLKDPDTAIAASPEVLRLPPRVEAVEEALFG
jgi:threonine synthase